VATNANYANVAGSATDSNAFHRNVSNEIAGLTQKAVPANNDYILIEDSANGNSKAYIQVGTLPTGNGNGGNGTPAQQVIFTNSGNWTNPLYGVTNCVVTVLAVGGGGGGGGSNSARIGGGGGGGATIYAWAIVPSSIQTVTVTVGNGGGGGAANSNGNSGTISNFGSYVSVNGGNPGGYPSGVSNGAGGGGGAVNLYISQSIIFGFSGSNGGTNAAATGGDSGQNHGQGGTYANNTNGGNGGLYGGGGGGGGGSNTIGGTGAKGIVIVTYG
jgi:hypothetical protein